MGSVETIQGCSSCRGSRHSSQKRSVGCMSGILRLLTRHNRRSQKRLSPAPKKHNPVNVPSKAPIIQANEPTKLANPLLKRSSCEVPRSPTIPQELRRLSEGSPDSPRRSSVVVARLMGLDMAVPQLPAPESAAEKRRRLLGALEKCDEDLKALRRIIEAVRLAEVRMKTLETIGSIGTKGIEGADLQKEVEVEHRSPNSVLDAIYSPRFRSKRSDINENQSCNVAAGSRIVKPSRMGVIFGDHPKKIKDDTEQERIHHHRPLVNEGIPRTFTWKEISNSTLRNWHVRDNKSSSTAFSVEKIWETTSSEERREFDRIEVMLEWGIFGDLVEEVIVELYFCFNKLSVTLRRTCRKRLYF
ncbi:hypothetical protein LUZ63_007720 [Rhynchospora breviuscula]|uniref:DUF3741 domain-containing protein n=1 Tax=Rhynchospora breviuscula TaxID=2022672 RepID=A0A9Q0HVB0_9POAL|nr:hypothetical protein LUZ63_007720 [Rhynchospora breviuscula]